MNTVGARDVNPYLPPPRLQNHEVDSRLLSYWSHYLSGDISNILGARD
jgi:hypothetical protein